MPKYGGRLGDAWADTTTPHGRLMLTRDDAADVAQTVRARALSRQDLMSRPASGRLTALLKLDGEQLKEAVTAPPQSNAAPVADGRKPSLGRQTRPRRLQRVAGAFPRG